METASRAGTTVMARASVATLHLGGSLLVALLAAVALIKTAVYLDYRETLALALPVLPSIFPVCYRVLAHAPAAPAPPRRRVAPGTHRGLWRRLSAMRCLRLVLAAVGLGLVVKYAVEALFLGALYVRSGLPFHAVFGDGGDGLLGCFLRGELLSVTASRILPLLAIELVALSAVAGLWIGSRSSFGLSLETVAAATALALLVCLTNVNLLYAELGRHGEALASRAGAAHPAAGALAGPACLVLLFGCWAAAGRRLRRAPSAR
jgi:hypothetical protein